MENNGLCGIFFKVYSIAFLVDAKIYRIFANGKKEEIKKIQNSYMKIDKKKIPLNLK